MTKDDAHDVNDKGEAWQIVNSANSDVDADESVNESENPLGNQPEFPDDGGDDGGSDDGEKGYSCGVCGGDLWDYRPHDSHDFDFMCVDCNQTFKETKA